MKRFVIIIIAVLSLWGFQSISSAQSQHQQKKEIPVQKPKKAPKYVYTCPMHPEVKSYKPGKCQKCGMELEKSKIKKGSPPPHQKKN